MAEHTERRGNITLRLFIREDELGVRGNASASGDDAFDEQVENEILARLKRGDTWAWASVEVEATYNGLGDDIVGREYLGCCSYANVEEFIQPDGYYPQMATAAIADLEEKLTREIAKMQTAVDAMAAAKEEGK